MQKQWKLKLIFSRRKFLSSSETYQAVTENSGSKQNGPRPYQHQPRHALRNSDVILTSSREVNCVTGVLVHVVND